MKKVITRIVSIMMALVLCLTAIPFTGMTALAASGSINSLPTTIKSYPISTGNNTPGYASKGASSKSGTVYAADLCTIKTIYGDGYISVTYPTSGGKTRTLYFKSNSFFNGTTYKTASITKYATAYRRSSGSATIGSVDSADKLVYVVGNAVNGRYQIVYKVTGSNYYKLGWVSTSAVKFDGSNNSSNTGLRSPVPSGCYFNKKTSDNGFYCYHDINVNVSTSTPVYAIADGTVTFYQAYRTYNGTKYLTSYGNYIKFTSADGKTTAVYAHLNKFVGVSQTIPSSRTKQVSGSAGTLNLGTINVKAGQVIGYIGSTGNSSGNHLHFELRLNGNRVDPTSVIPGLTR